MKWIVVLLFVNGSSVDIECTSYNCGLGYVNEALYSNSKAISKIQIYEPNMFYPNKMTRINDFPPKEEYWFQ